MECNICYKDVESFKVPCCNFYMCKKCWNAVYDVKKECPYCRSSLNSFNCRKSNDDNVNSTLNCNICCNNNNSFKLPCCSLYMCKECFNNQIDHYTCSTCNEPLNLVTLQNNNNVFTVNTLFRLVDVCLRNELLFGEIILPNYIEKFNCALNEIHSIIIPDDSRLIELNCEYNQITSLILPNSLQQLNCMHNQLQSLVISKGIKTVKCDHKVNVTYY